MEKNDDIVLEREQYTVKGDFRVKEAGSYPEGIHGYRNVALVAEGDWDIAGIEGMVGSHKLRREQSGEEGVAGEYVSRIEAKDSISTGGAAKVSGRGNIAFISGFGTVKLNGLEGAPLCVEGSVSLWRENELGLFSSYVAKEDSCIATVVSDYGNDSMLTTTSGKRQEAGENFTMKANASNTSLNATNCQLADVLGYGSVTLDSSSAGSVVGGQKQEANSCVKTFTERRQTRDVYEFPYMPFYMRHDEEHVLKEKRSKAQLASGTLKLRNGSCVGGDVRGYKTVNVGGSIVEGDITGGSLQSSSSFNENVSQSGYVLYIDKGSSAEVKTLAKSSTGSIKISGGAQVHGRVSGYENVTVSNSICGDFSWAVEDEVMGLQNGRYSYRKSTKYSNDCADINEKSEYRASHGGSISVSNSNVGNITGYDKVTVISSQVGGIAQDMLAIELKNSSYGYCCHRPVYAVATDAEAYVMAANYAASDFLFCTPNVTEAASGKLKLLEATVSGGISGYANVSSEGGSIEGGIRGGRHYSKSSGEKTSLMGSLSLKNLELGGDISGYNSVKMQGVTAMESSIYMGEHTVKADGSDVYKLAGTVSLKDCMLGGTISLPSSIMLENSTLGALDCAVSGNALSQVTIKDSRIDGDVTGNVSISFSGECGIGGSVACGQANDKLTVKKGASLTLAGDVDLGEGKNQIEVQKNASLKMTGDWQVREGDALKVNGELFLLGQATALWENDCISGTGRIYLDSQAWEARKGIESSFKGTTYDIGEHDVAQFFQGAAAESGDNSISGAVDLLDWMKGENTRNGWLCGKENVYHIMNEATSRADWIHYDPYPIWDWDLVFWPRYFIDKEDCFSLKLEDALAEGYSTLEFSDNVNVYVFGDRWFDVLDRGEGMALDELCERHAGDTEVNIFVAVSGEKFAKPGTYTVTLA